VRLHSGVGQLECFVEQSDVKTGVHDVEVKRISPQ